MRPLVVVPFHDPKWLENVEANLARQTAEARVVFATNGKAAGFESTRWQTTPSGNSHADAVNAGVAWARARDFTHVVLFDSDDYYGPAYVEHALAALERADFCGKRRIFTRLQDGQLHLFERPGRCFVFASVAFRLDRFVEVRDVQDNCLDWSARMRDSGSSSVDTGPADYCYLRHGGNAHWDGRIPDVMVRAAWGPSRCYGAAPDDTVDSPDGWAPRAFTAKPSDAEIMSALTT